ncbi:MetQ/NlpA family ABC transporter substrate-binding protein [Nocardioides sp. ChNu-99]|uniref:MetQ/NlpA family ABC transporter substrate-binding protein n=1 Tax=Nocardioides sp. ChNu-99 TaxID=2839897 RepID=UPI002405488F|nr:MetQ/NlpA family ABC transporter substrate-binding protein [Nocardioides sp. ChNu-99]MDF9717055.1 methionine ABC transporter substrate-binding protein [Nocardioides sp. ChNu-99]
MSHNIPLVEKPKSRLPLVAAVVAVLLVAAAVLVFVLTRGDDEVGADGQPLTEVTIGVADASEEYWDTFATELEDEGIELDIQNFTDYLQPNPSLSEGAIEVNQFQHLLYLAGYNVANDDDLTPIGSTAIYPLGLYSNDYDSPEDIPDGETVVVPDDDTNQARALLMLQEAGLVELADGGSAYSTVDDVEDSSRVEVRAVQADLTGASLPDVAAAVINNDFVENTGLTFDDAIATDDPADASAQPYVNIFVVRAEDADDETYRTLVEVYQSSEAVQEGVLDASGGTAELVEVPAEELQATLADLEEQTREANAG